MQKSSTTVPLTKVPRLESINKLYINHLPRLRNEVSYDLLQSLIIRHFDARDPVYELTSAILVACTNEPNYCWSGCKSVALLIRSSARVCFLCHFLPHFLLPQGLSCLNISRIDTIVCMEIWRGKLLFKVTYCWTELRTFSSKRHQSLMKYDFMITLKYQGGEKDPEACVRFITILPSWRWYIAISRL